MAKAKIVLDDDGLFYGIKILCPGCLFMGGSSIPHILWVKQLPAGMKESPHAKNKPHWDWNGNLDKPTFRPSLLNYIDTPNGRRCHSWITDGCIEFLGDCTHALKGQTVDLPEITEEA